MARTSPVAWEACPSFRQQYFEFARDLAASYLVMERGEVVLSGRRGEMDEAAVRTYLTV